MLDTDKIVGLQVVGTKDGKVLGQVTQVICDLASGEMLGLVLGKGAAEKGVLAKDIKTIGEDAVMVEDSAVARHLSELPELMQRRRDPSEAPILVLTDDGSRLGHLSRIWIDPVAKKVTRYEVSAGLLRTLTEGALLLPVVPGSVHGEDTLVVPAAELAALAATTGGLRAQLERLSAKLREEAAVAREQAGKAAKAAKEQTEKAAQTAREQAAKAAEAVREQVSKEEDEAGEEAQSAEPQEETGGDEPAASEESEAAEETEASEDAQELQDEGLESDAEGPQETATEQTEEQAHDEGAEQ